MSILCVALLLVQFSCIFYVFVYFVGPPRHVKYFLSFHSEMFEGVKKQARQTAVEVQVSAVDISSCFHILFLSFLLFSDLQWRLDQQW